MKSLIGIVQVIALMQFLFDFARSQASYTKIANITLEVPTGCVWISTSCNVTADTKNLEVCADDNDVFKTLNATSEEISSWRVRFGERVMLFDSVNFTSALAARGAINSNKWNNKCGAADKDFKIKSLKREVMNTTATKWKLVDTVKQTTPTANCSWITTSEATFEFCGDVEGKGLDVIMNYGTKTNLFANNPFVYTFEKDSYLGKFTEWVKSNVTKAIEVNFAIGSMRIRNDNDTSSFCVSQNCNKCVSQQTEVCETCNSKSWINAGLCSLRCDSNCENCTTAGDICQKCKTGFSLKNGILNFKE